MKDTAFSRSRHQLYWHSRYISLCGFSILWSFLLSTVAFAVDTTWIVGNAGWDTPGSWDTAAVPGAGDRAIFNESATIAGYAVGLNISNDFVSDVLFSGTTKGVFWRGGATNTLTVGNSFVMDQPIGATALGTLRDVTVAVTNGSGTGVFKVGNNTDGGIGFLVMEQQTVGVVPTLIADQFVLTTNSTFTFRGGTLTILHGSTMDRGANTAFNIGSTAPQVPNWIMLGGTNTVTYTGATGTTSLGSAAGAGANVTVSGPNTLWQVGGTQLSIGQNAAATLTVSNGAHVATTVGRMGNNTLAGSNNVLAVTGAGSRVDFIGINPAAAVLTIGNVAPSNQLIITGGAIVNATNGFVTVGSSTITASADPANNLMKVDGSGSLFEASDLLQFGGGAPSNTLIISNGGVIRSGSSTAASRLGRDLSSTDNSALIDGIGSLWEITGPSGFSLGNNGPRNTLTVQNGGALVVSGGAMLVGAGSSSTGNQIGITGGSITVTNATTSAALDDRNGTITFNGGTVTVDRLFVTNAATSVFTFNSGVLNVSTSVVSNGSAFTVGNGISAATLNLLAAGHTYATGLTIANNGTLTGAGTITANVTLSDGAVLAPGGIIAGTLTVTGTLVLNPTTILDYKLDAPAGVGDLVNVVGDLTLDGTLNVSNLGGFAAGNYTVFSYTGSLVNNTLNVGTLPGGFGGTISNDTVNKLVLLVATSSLPSDPFASWEIQYFGSTNCAKCGGTKDFDGDGMNNTNEFLVGFNPTNSAAYAHVISIVKSNSNNDVRVTYLGANGDSTRTPAILTRTNVLEFTAGTANGSYATNNFASTGVTNILSGGTGIGAVSTMVDPSGATNKPSRFYRVRVLAP